MSERKPDEKPKESNPAAGEEPSLFEEKPSTRHKRKSRLFLIIVMSAIGILIWPRGQIKGEALVQAERFTRMGLTSSGILKELLHRKGDLVKSELTVYGNDADYTFMLAEIVDDEMYFQAIDDKGKTIDVGSIRRVGKVEPGQNVSTQPVVPQAKPSPRQPGPKGTRGK